MRWIALFGLLATLVLSGCSQDEAAAINTSGSLSSGLNLTTPETGVGEDPPKSEPATTTTTNVPPTTVPTTWQPLQAGARVLLIGDSISIGYAESTQRALPSMEIVHHEGNARSTNFALASNRIYSWLGGQPWDVIHFNFGLHDLSFVDAQGNEVDAGTPGSTPQADLVEYEQNLQRIVETLNATGARLIWATSTPVYETEGSRLANAEVAYNEVASRVMKRNGIQVNDLHQFAIENLSKQRVNGEDNIHYTKSGYETMSKAVVEILLSTPT